MLTTIAASVSDENIIFYICVTVIIIVALICTTILILTGRINLEIFKSDDNGERKITVEHPFKHDLD